VPSQVTPIRLDSSGPVISSEKHTLHFARRIEIAHMGRGTVHLAPLAVAPLPENTQKRAKDRSKSWWDGPRLLLLLLGGLFALS